MVNVKDEVFNALSKKFDRPGEDHVTDQYPKDWATLPAVQYTEENNRIHGTPSASGGKLNEDYSDLAYRVDIWHSKSTSAAAILVDEAMGVHGLGLLRTMCQDVPDPSGLKHKVMRYTGIMNTETKEIYYE